MLHVLEVWEGVKLCMSVVVLPSSNVPVGFYFVLYQVNYENMQTCSMLLFLKMLSKHQFRLVKFSGSYSFRGNWDITGITTLTLRHAVFQLIIHFHDVEILNPNTKEI